MEVSCFIIGWALVSFGPKRAYLVGATALTCKIGAKVSFCPEPLSARLNKASTIRATSLRVFEDRV